MSFIFTLLHFHCHLLLRLCKLVQSRIEVRGMDKMGLRMMIRMIVVHMTSNQHLIRNVNNQLGDLIL